MPSRPATPTLKFLHVGQQSRKGIKLQRNCYKTLATGDKDDEGNFEMYKKIPSND